MAWDALTREGEEFTIKDQERLQGHTIVFGALRSERGHVSVAGNRGHWHC